MDEDEKEGVLKNMEKIEGRFGTRAGTGPWTQSFWQVTTICGLCYNKVSIGAKETGRKQDDIRGSLI